MKNLVLSFLFTILTFQLHAQQEKILHDGHEQYRSAIDEGRYEEAYQHAYVCWKTLKGMSPQRDSLLGLAAYYLSYTLYLNDNPEEALTYALEAKKMIERSYGEESVNYALVVNTTSMIYSDLDEYDLAETYSLEAIRVYEMHLPRKEYDYFAAKSNLASLYDILGQPQEAKVLYRSILDQYTLDKSAELYTAVLMNWALLHESLGEYAVAEAAYLEAQQIFKENNQVTHPNYAILLTNMGILYHSLEQFEQTENLFLQAIEIFSNESLGNFYDISSAYSGLAILYSDMEQYKKAEEYYLKTVALTKEFMGSNSYDYAWSISNLGVYYEEIGNFEKAKEKYLEAQQIFLKIFDDQHISYATNLSHLSSVYLGIEDWDQSLLLANQSLVLLENIRGKQHVGYLILMNRIAEIYCNKGNYSKALDYAFQTLEINGDFLFSNDKIDKAWCATILKHSFLSFVDLNTSLEIIWRILDEQSTEDALQKQLMLVEMVMTIFERHRNEYSTEEDKLYTLTQSTAWAEQGIMTIGKHRAHPNWNQYKKQAFDFAEKNKSVLLTGDLQAEKAYSFGDLPDSLAQKEQLLQKEYDDYKAYLSDDITEEERQEIYTYLSDLFLEKNAFKEYIEANYPKYNQLKYAATTVSIEEVQATLDATTALLEYSVSDSMITVFYIDQQQFELYTLPVSYKTLSSKIGLLHHTLSDYQILLKAPERAFRRYTDVAYWFYENLLKEVLSGKDKIDQLVLVTDRELGHLPFETFLVENSANQQGYKSLHYLMNDYAISYDYSATLWKENLSKSERPNNDKLLAMAAVYKQSLTSKGHRSPFYQQQRSMLSPLPAAINEVNTLAKIFESDVVTGVDANEHFFKEKASEYGIIHLAMHGVLNRKAPILSSLVLTENNDTLENNFLQAYEISKMDLNANLVVLSACETGYGKFERGNGIASLARSFMYAGVPAMVVSLWQVNDQSTAIVMHYFYENLKQGSRKSIALRAAKQRYLSEVEGIYAHPAFWSSFIQLGNNQAIELSKKNTVTKYWWILITVFLIMIVGIGFKAWKKE